VDVAPWEDGPLRALVPLCTRGELKRQGMDYVWVAGIAHHLEAAQSEDFAPGAHLSLRGELDNPDDAEAVAVLDAHGSTMAGYVPRSLAVRLKRLTNPSAVAIGEGRVDGRRVAIAMLVSGEPIELRMEERPRDEVLGYVSLMPPLRLPGVGNAVDPLEQMASMAAWLSRRSRRDEDS